MDKQAILSALTPEIVEKFRQAISLGKWEDGRKLTEEQRQTCMQAVMVRAPTADATPLSDRKSSLASRMPCWANATDTALSSVLPLPLA